MTYQELTRLKIEILNEIIDMLPRESDSELQDVRHLMGARINELEETTADDSVPCTRGDEPPKHTPGPWRVDRQSNFPHEYCLIRHRDVIIAKAWETGGDGEREANAQLIAAAPELLAACERALNYAENVANAEGVYFDADSDLPAIQAAIAKAKDPK